MPIQHIFYIPAIFLLGFVFGIMITERKRSAMAINSLVTARKNDPLLHKTSGKQLLQTFFFLFFLVFIITHMFEIPWGPKSISQLLGGQEIFDKSPVFSSAEVYKRLSQFPAEGIIAYRHFTYTIDFIFPFSFFLFLLTFARFVSQRISVQKYLVIALIGLPYFWFISDLVENAIIFSILSKFPTQIDFLASALGFITAIKFGLLLLAVITPSLLFIFSRNRSRSA